MRDFQINNSITYPKIITPFYLKDASNIKIRFEEIYPNIKKPKSDFSLSKNEVNEGKILVTGLGCGFIFYIVIGFICLLFSNMFLNVSTENWQKYWFPSILGVSFVGAVLTIIIGLKGQKIEAKKADEERKKAHDKYMDEMAKYNKLLESILSEDFQQKERKNRLYKQIEKNKNEIFTSLKILEDHSIKKGISEIFFHDFLLKFSNINIYKSVKYSFYYPDLILVKDNLVIALEIDEPYTIDSKEPIHYDNSDKSRDEYFISNGFVLIRFTEEQIISSPFKCLEIINDVISCCINVTDFKKSISFKDIEVKPWSYQDSFDMAYKNSRKDIPEKIRLLRLQYSL